jgi:hypothetical protein
MWKSMQGPVTNHPSNFKLTLLRRADIENSRRRRRTLHRRIETNLSPKMKKKKEDFICYVCGVSGHTAQRCKLRKGKCHPPQRK